MYAVKDRATGLYYAGKGALRWGTAEQAAWGTYTRARNVKGGLRNSRDADPIIVDRTGKEVRHADR